MNVEQIVSKLEWLNDVLDAGEDSFIMQELIPSVKANADVSNRSNVINLIRRRCEIEQLEVQCRYSALCLRMLDRDGAAELFKQIVFKLWTKKRSKNDDVCLKTLIGNV